jgi:arginyl-tRNA synthetase
MLSYREPAPNRRRAHAGFAIMKPMLLKRMAEVEDQLRQFVNRHFGVELPPLMIETPPRIEMGDLAFPFPFELARTLRKPPRVIAQEVAEQFPRSASISRVEAAGAGYVNIFFDRTDFFRDLYEWLQTPLPPGAGEKIVVEHTNINPNKAAHIGHLRNAALGDTFVRLLRAQGCNVEVQNYIDNTGVQVADVVVGFQVLRKMRLDQIQAIPDPFDYYCWDLYSEVSGWYGEAPENAQHRHRVLKHIEEGEGETARLAEYLSSRIVKAHLNTMFRLGVRYDVLPRESEILHMHFWSDAFEQLKSRKAISFVEEGPNAGCWVMQLSDESAGQAEEKIIVRSNGTVTYVGKDIAYQLWKFGLLDKDFRYRPFHRYPDGQTVWVSSLDPGTEEAPAFGRAARVYNVIDVRQSYLQRVVVEGLRSLGFTDQADRSIHFSYEMVALSINCCLEMGIALSEEDRQKPYVEVSGRKGLGVKADDLIDKLIEKSLQEVALRQPDLDMEKRENIAHSIAIGALRYFLLKYTRNSVIAFDSAEALSFEGETGPYLQYSVVRANNIFRKLSQREPSQATTAEDLWRQGDAVNKLLQESELWELLLQAARIDDMIDQSVKTMEMSYLAKHAFTLAQQFNLFYHKHHILSEEDPLKKQMLLTVTDVSRLGLERMMRLLGIDVPERM